MTFCTRHGTTLQDGEKCHPCEIDDDPEFMAEKIEDLETENAGCADKLSNTEKERDELKAKLTAEIEQHDWTRKLMRGYLEDCHVQDKERRDQIVVIEHLESEVAIAKGAQTK